MRMNGGLNYEKVFTVCVCAVAIVVFGSVLFRSYDNRIDGIEDGIQQSIRTEQRAREHLTQAEQRVETIERRIERIEDRNRSLEETIRDSRAEIERGQSIISAIEERAKSER